MGSNKDDKVARCQLGRLNPGRVKVGFCDGYLRYNLLFPRSHFLVVYSKEHVE
jgi:hypothetical protein